MITFDTGEEADALFLDLVAANAVADALPIPVPTPSVLSAWIVPSSRKVSVLAAPIKAARSVT